MHGHINVPWVTLDELNAVRDVAGNAVPKSTTINGKSLTSNIELTYSDVGASPKGHKHSPSEIGAAPANHTHSPASIGAAPASHSHSNYVPTTRRINGKLLNSDINLTASDVGASPSAHTHSASQVGALPISGGTLTGDLRLKNNSNFGTTLRFGDGDLAYIREPADDHLEIHAAHSIRFTGMDTASTNPLPINQGGTGATTAAQARSNLSAAASNHTHSQYASTSHTHTAEAIGALPISGGTLTGDLRLKNGTYGRTLRFGDGDLVYLKEPTDDHLEIHAKHSIRFTGLDTVSSDPLPISQGGTKATTAAQALENLGGLSRTGGTIDGNLTINGDQTLNGDLRIWGKEGNYDHGGKLRFGDKDYAYIMEPIDDHLEIHAHSIRFTDMGQTSPNPLPIRQGGTGVTSLSGLKDLLGSGVTIASSTPSSLSDGEVVLVY